MVFGASPSRGAEPGTGVPVAQGPKDSRRGQDGAGRGGSGRLRCPGPLDEEPLGARATFPHGDGVGVEREAHSNPIGSHKRRLCTTLTTDGWKPEVRVPIGVGDRTASALSDPGRRSRRDPRAGRWISSHRAAGRVWGPSSGALTAEAAPSYTVRAPPFGSLDLPNPSVLLVSTTLTRRAPGTAPTIPYCHSVFPVGNLVNY